MKRSIVVAVVLGSLACGAGDEDKSSGPRGGATEAGAPERLDAGGGVPTGGSGGAAGAIGGAGGQAGRGGPDDPGGQGGPPKDAGPGPSGAGGTGGAAVDAARGPVPTEPGGTGGAAGASLSFENDIYPIIEVSCATAACHGNPNHASKLYMPDVQTAYRNLVEADATYPCTFTNGAGQKVTIAKRVVPGNPEASALRQRVRPGPPAECPKGTWSRMPKGSFPSDGHTAAVLQWIAGGAKP